MDSLLNFIKSFLLVDSKLVKLPEIVASNAAGRISLSHHHAKADCEIAVKSLCAIVGWRNERKVLNL